MMQSNSQSEMERSPLLHTAAQLFLLCLLWSLISPKRLTMKEAPVALSPEALQAKQTCPDVDIPTVSQCCCLKLAMCDPAKDFATQSALLRLAASAVLRTC